MRERFMSAMVYTFSGTAMRGGHVTLTFMVVVAQEEKNKIADVNASNILNMGVKI